MNFLAHLYLYDGPTEERLGSMLADFVKGRQFDELSGALQRGVLHHRKVDAFTDSHPMFRQSVVRLKAKWGRYSPILVDVFYDHFLATFWSEYDGRPLRDFLNNVYTEYQDQRESYPYIITRPMDRIVASDRLMTYRQLDGIEDALRRISSLLKRRRVELHPAVGELRANYEGLAEDFHAFFPELRVYSESIYDLCSRDAR